MEVKRSNELIYIYTITCTVTKKIYVGQTKNPKDRWRRHKLKSSSCHKVRHSINKYGIDNHLFEPHMSVECRHKANELEVRLIKHLGTVDNGLNIQAGGALNNSTKGRRMGPHTPERRANISASKKGKRWSPETRVIMTEARKGKSRRGEKHQWYGKRGEQTPSSKISDIQRSEIVTKYDNGITQKQLASEYGLSQPHISTILKKWRKDKQ